MRRIVASLAALALLLGGLGRAQASILYDNLSAASSGSDSVSDVGPLADSFSTGTLAAQLTDVKLLLALPAGTPATNGTISVDLYSDNSTSPGSLLTNIGTLFDTSLTTSFTAEDFTLGTPFNLAANTRYWIEVSTTNGSLALWSYSSDTSGTGVANEYLYNNNGGVPQVFANNQGGEPYQMQVNADVAAAPEPSSILLLAVGFLVTVGAPLGSLRRRPTSECNPAS